MANTARRMARAALIDRATEASATFREMLQTIGRE
jgi:hypothetical protein